MTRLLRVLPVVALLALGCKAKPPAHRMGTSVNIAPTGVFQVIPASMNPNDAGLPGAVGTRVQNAGGANAWDKTSDGLWHALSGASGGGTVSSATPPLQIVDGGVMQIAAATESTAGSISAADKTKLDGLAAGAPNWANTEAAAIATAIPAITRFKMLQIPSYVSPVTTAPSATGAAVEGNGILSLSTTLNTYFGLQIFLQPKTGPWSFSCLEKLLGSGAAGHDNYVGILNAAHTHGYVGGWNHATSASKFTLQLYGAANVFVAGTLNGDSNTHVQTVMNDGTTVYYSVDGNIVATTTSLGGMADEPMYPVLYAATISEAAVYECMIGFLSPL